MIAQAIIRQLYGQDIWNGVGSGPADSVVEGWNGDHPALGRLARGVCIDVGVWHGQSTLTMAKALKASGDDGCVIAVDTFLGSEEHWFPPFEIGPRIHGRPTLYEIFLANVKKAELTDFVVPLAQTTTIAALILRRLGIVADVVHIDASHERAAVLRDIEDYWRLLRPGGTLIGDDYHESWVGVVQAAGEFSAKIGLCLGVEGAKWMLRKPEFIPASPSA